MADGAGSKVSHPTNYMETMMHLLKGCVGTGLFAMGDAFKNTGLFLGIFLLAGLGFISVYAEHQLIRASKQLRETLNLEFEPDFPGTVELVFTTGPDNIHKFGPILRVVTELFLCLTHLGFCCVYIVFVASTFQQVLDYFGHSWDIHVLMVLVTIPMLLSCLIRHLKYLAPVSIFANILLFASALVCLYYACQDIPPISSRTYVADWRQLPLFFGTALFALTVIGLILPLRSEMADPPSFEKPLGVLNIGSFFVISLYVVMGFLCYLKWGDTISGSVTLDLDQTQVLPQFVKMATAFSIMFTYAISFYVPFVLLWPALCERHGPFSHPLATEICFRISMVLLTFVLAEVIPFLSLLISLVGALSGSALALLIPSILDYVMCWRTSTVTLWVIIKNLIIFAVGLVGAVSGTYVSLYNIVQAFQNSTTSTSKPNLTRTIVANLINGDNVL